MILTEQILILLVVVHLITVTGFIILKRSKHSEKFRSSQTHPANLGSTALQVGGMVIVPTTIITAISLFYFSKSIPLNVQIIFFLPTLLLFVVGFIDDYRPISAPFRLTVHFVVAISITLYIFQLTGYAGLVTMTSVTGFIIPSIFMVLAICWLINTTNFIDGMDLFLVANVVPGSVLFALLYFQTNQDVLTSLVFLIFLSSLAGFAWFNRPKASIYMGDAGALSIGSMLGGVGVLIFAKYGSIAGFLPFTAILTDTTFTLAGIIANGNNPLKSHSHHAYQVAAKNGKSENSIRALYLLVSTINTFFAYLCFLFDHSVIWQFSLGLAAFLISSILFIRLHKKPIT